MPKDRTLRMIEREMEAGQLGRARDRLHGLLATYPADLTLRARLAEVYWRLQHPEMAGRYWYLQEPTEEKHRTARREFERSCGDDPLQMLRAVKLRAALETLPEAYARRALLLLQEHAESADECKMVFTERGVKLVVRPVVRKPPTGWWHWEPEGPLRYVWPFARFALAVGLGLGVVALFVLAAALVCLIVLYFAG